MRQHRIANTLYLIKKKTTENDKDSCRVWLRPIRKK